MADSSSRATPANLPQPTPLLAGRARIAWLAALVILCAVVPLLNLVVPAGSVFHISDFMVALVGKIMCYAICALAMDLIWGYTGILSLGHGLFFALGGYVMGMYLMREIGLDGNYKSALPDFMVFLDWKTLPWHWALSHSLVATLLLIVLVPGLVALVFGYFAFRSRIKGVYFSIITRRLPSPPCCCSSATRPALAATTGLPISSASPVCRLPRRRCACSCLC